MQGTLEVNLGIAFRNEFFKSMRNNLLLARGLLTDIPFVILSFSGDHEGPHHFYN